MNQTTRVTKGYLCLLAWLCFAIGSGCQSDSDNSTREPSAGDAQSGGDSNANDSGGAGGTGGAGGASGIGGADGNDGSQTCGSCHEIPPRTGRHPSNFAFHETLGCTDCHGDVADRAGTTITNATLHNNGANDVILAGGTWDPVKESCNAGVGCHGPAYWGVPK